MAGRPSIVGDQAGPEAPYPLQMEGKVISGFGRGSKEVSEKDSLTSPSLLTSTPPFLRIMSHLSSYPAIKSLGSPPPTSRLTPPSHPGSPPPPRESTLATPPWTWTGRPVRT
uniref:Riboflavin kinase n=1 Tax=Bionectria ochroleuca TaxID=29856 RepID=A0A8H7NF47_BIOOC